jgi:putative FmdB family regulatory protein
MPIYEYECTKCGKIEEVLQNFSDKPLTKCQSCTGKLHKLVSQSTFHLKGTGWYVTDYANKSAKAQKPSSKNRKSKPADTTSSDTGSDSIKKTNAESS